MNSLTYFLFKYSVCLCHIGGLFIVKKEYQSFNMKLLNELKPNMPITANCQNFLSLDGQGVMCFRKIYYR